MKIMIIISIGYLILAYSTLMFNIKYICILTWSQVDYNTVRQSVIELLQINCEFKFQVVRNFETTNIYYIIAPAGRISDQYCCVYLNEMFKLYVCIVKCIIYTSSIFPCTYNVDVYKNRTIN